MIVFAEETDFARLSVSRKVVQEKEGRRKTDGAVKN
jgi:hypothetical protein